jgi:hypothetical protein
MNKPKTTNKRDWTLNADKRDAAQAFLEEVAQNDTLRNKIVMSGKDDRVFARAEFARLGNIDIPKNVEVICLEPDKDHLNQVVVFKLPESGTSSSINPLKFWLAGWVPYGPPNAARPGKG